ncbi:NADH-dependent fumarate reductase [Micractinium conductrix]|uniref:fumarate reductase (NADH) n=1 Tax=Micractinium conductrix TaxID=554055 RepID=A0A2P6VNT7_9CHLO|nr:NADH-dependent fumarate reductase [Micractinium conductrix]|eukprot:PSC75715.1 NADH-dependent fumarate reductase [Micractinium conductrix]
MAAPIAGKTVVVVGGSRGIGAEFVRQFAAKGNRVIATARTPAQAAKELEGTKVELTQLDVTSPQSVEQWAAEVQKLAPHIDLLINNAGVYSRRVGFSDVTHDDMLAAFTTNAIGPLMVVQQLHKRGVLGGARPTLVANVTSKVGSIDDNKSGGGYAYRASKTALNIINKSLSIDLAGDNITCTLLHPGYVRTDMTGGAGLIDKEESVRGMIGVLESGVELQGTFHDFAGKDIPWPQLVDALVDGSLDALAFLQSEGVDLSSVVQMGGQSIGRTHSPPSGPPVGAAIMQALQRAAQRQGNLDVWTGVQVCGLAQETGSGAAGWSLAAAVCAPGTAPPELGGGGPVSGDASEQPQAESEDAAPTRLQRLHADAVVLATGGFAASQALLQRHAPYAAGLGTTNGAFATGDGLALGQQAGAALVDVGWVQLNPTGIIDPHDPSAATKTVAPERLRGLGAILLNSQGRRFVNELGTRDKVAGAILEQPERHAFLLVGSSTAASFGAASLQPYLQRQLISQAASLDQLAADTGMPAEALAAELQAYDQAAVEGRDSFGKTAFPARIHLLQPMYWARVAPVAHYCMGGLAIDRDARVLDAQGRPIPGLFAAGEVAGGVHGKNLLVGDALLECVVFGVRAGAAAAAAAAAAARAKGPEGKQGGAS